MALHPILLASTRVAKKAAANYLCLEFSHHLFKTLSIFKL